MELTINAEQITQVIRNRRSVFPPQYTGQVIDRAIIEEMLENANWAPTHKRTEPWRFVVFSGEGLKKLADFQSSLYKKVTMEKGTFEDKKYETLATKPLMASHIIAIALKRDEEETIPEIEEIEAVACAVQNMSLTAAAHGLGAYWGTGGITYWPEANDFFDLGPKDKLLGFLYVGVPKRMPNGKRNPIEDKVKWVS